MYFHSFFLEGNSESIKITPFTFSTLLFIYNAWQMPVLIFGQFTEYVQITEQPQSQPVRVGSTVTLRCKATGYPAPQYQWVKDGTELPDGIDEELTFDPVTLQDSGKYVCIVSNRINAEKTNKVELQVLPSPGSLIEVLQVTLQYQCPCYLNCISPLSRHIVRPSF